MSGPVLWLAFNHVDGGICYIRADAIVYFWPALDSVRPRVQAYIGLSNTDSVPVVDTVEQIKSTLDLINAPR